MTISKTSARVWLTLAVAAGLVLPAGFGPARAVESKTPSGNGDQTKTQTANRSGVRMGRRKAMVGTASWYGGQFHGRRTYSGERFNQHAMTLASRRLPMGTRVRVTNLRTGKSAVGRVNDYGPNGRHKNRVADLSLGLARKVGLTPAIGVTKVRIEVVK